MEGEKLLGYLQQGIGELLEQGGFDGGQEFRRTQKQAIEAYQRYLQDDTLSLEEKLKGFFEIPTGVGKTAVFVGIVSAAQKAAQANGDELKTVIVVPTLPLLNQTLEAFQGNDKKPNEEGYFAGFAPWLRKKIGLYGGRRKNLKLPFTVMTYDAWANRLEDGTLNPDNVDILITDEAHRGTSENRVDLTKLFNDLTTLKVAFTATAEFDEEKSVYNSHERRIFYKPVAEAIRDKELANGVYSQRFGIRVDPDEYMLSDEFKEASFERKVAYRQAARQNAWNKKMLKVFREGHAPKTGDPLSDNQAGFFVEGIWQADKMEALLNSDPVLNEKAKSMGYEGVAVAIHSDLSPTEQNRRIKAYKEGKYLAAVGDQKFKEGFDHPPMKTIFDTPRESRVDKAQIIGRGLRKWWNELKGRYEGLTVIECFMWFANEDLEKEAQNKANAKFRTLSVKSIIGSSHIDVDLPTYTLNGSSSGGSGGGGGRLFDDDPDVDEYSTLEEVFELDSEIDAFYEDERLTQENIVAVDVEMRTRLDREIDRTGLGPIGLFNKFKEDSEMPDTLTPGKIIGWRNGTSIVDMREWAWVLGKFTSLPDAMLITEKDRAQLIAEIERTGIGALRFHAMFDDIPQELTYSNLRNLSMDRRRINKDYWDWVLEKYKGLPAGDATIDISPEMAAELNRLAEYTGVGSQRLIKMAGVPEGMRHQTIENWRSGASTVASSPQWKWVMQTYRELPEKPVKVEITEQMRQKLAHSKDATGVGGAKLLKSEDAPEGLKASTIANWISGRSKIADQSYWNWVVGAYAELLDEAPKEENLPDGPAL